MTNGQRRRLTAALLGGMCFLSSIYSLMGPLLGSIIERFNLTDSSQGLASAAASAGGVLALLSSFFLIGRLTKATLLRVSIGLCAVMLALLRFAPTFSLFIAVWLVLGVGLGYIDMLLSSGIADLYEGRAARTMMCILHMMYGVSSTIFPVIYSALMNAGLAWYRVYLFTAALGAILLIYLVTTLISLRKKNIPLRLTQLEAKMPLQQMGRVLKSGAMPACLAAIFCCGILIGGMNTWLNRYVGVTLNSSFGTVAASFFFFGLMISRLAVPLLPVTTERYLRFAGIAAGVLILAALPAKNGLLMCIAVCVGSLFHGAMIPCVLNRACEETPESTMLATTAMMLALYVAQGIAPPLLGLLESLVSLHAGIALCAVAIIGASLCCFSFKEKAVKTSA